MQNPFEDHLVKPKIPDLAFTAHRVSDQDNDHEFCAFPDSSNGSPRRVSPDIFARSQGRTRPFEPTSTVEDEISATPRARYTSRESPVREQTREILLTDQASASDQQLSALLSRSERLLNPPQPIFTPTTYEAAQSISGSSASDHGTLFSEHSYHSYQKEFENSEDFAETHTLLHSEYGSHTSAESDYFGASIDGDIMRNVNEHYIPNQEKTFTRRRVRLVGGRSGNLVLENRIPEELRKVLTKTESPFGEFTNMTYTACTSDPDDFVSEGFTLRSAKFGRETELVVCVTMYNEDEHAFTRTMHGIMKNVAHLCSRSRSSVWGKDSWKKVQVVIVADGRNKVNESVLQVLSATGCYQENLARPFVNNKKVRAHLFEYTTQISVDENLKFKGDEKSLCPVQVLFCLKEKNQKKINSHRWLFNAFCPVLDPNVIVLLDVGTKPDNHAIYNLWKAFDRDSNVAGAAGEITAMKGKGWINLLNPLVASQNFEYKLSNILDKPLESVFGYISVLPGALSAYRYIALQNHEDGTGPLASYFKGEDLLTENHAKNSKTSFFEANMYLAEDRILCWELIAKRNENWVLKFVKQATGETDVPESVPEFLSQRRRWINGAFFAALYSLRKSNLIWNTSHSLTRKLALVVEFTYQFVTLLMSFFALSNFYLTFYYLTGSLIVELGRGGFWIFTLFNYLCICVLTSLFVASIGNRPQASQNVFKVLMIMLTICALYALIVGLYFVIHTIKLYGMGDSSTYVFVSTVVSLLATYGLYTLMSILYLDPWHMVTCSLQYFLMVPSYTCTLPIFAFCNTHDVSWGTKGDNNPEVDRTNRYVIEKNEEGEFEATVMDYNIDEAYLETLYSIRARRSNRKVQKPKHEHTEIGGEDYAKDVRTKVVLVWLLCNLIFIMTMLQVYEAGEITRNYYLATILWSVAVLALFRALGSAAYLLQNLARNIVQTKSKWVYSKQGYRFTKSNSLNS